MTEEVTLKSTGTGATSITLNVKSIKWNMAANAHRFSPATIAILGDVTGDKKFGNFVVYFGKQQEDLTLSVQFDTDTDWKAFRTWLGKTAYFDSNTTGSKTKTLIEIYWGKAGDPFYTGQEDLYPTSGKFKVFISSVNVEREFPHAYWTGDIKLWMAMEVV